MLSELTKQLDTMADMTIKRVDYEPYDNAFRIVTKEGPCVTVTSDGYDDGIMVWYND
jgi:hypothetical protein